MMGWANRTFGVKKVELWKWYISIKCIYPSLIHWLIRSEWRTQKNLLLSLPVILATLFLYLVMGSGHREENWVWIQNVYHSYLENDALEIKLIMLTSLWCFTECQSNIHLSYLLHILLFEKISFYWSVFNKICIHFWVE